MFSSNFITTAGVRQRNPLSSTLFSICINDFSSLVCEAEDIDVDTEQNYNCLLFADDIDSIILVILARNFNRC